MNSIGYIDINTPLGFSYLKTRGELKLKQKSPIPHMKKPISDYYYGTNQEKMLGADEKNEISPFDLVKIFEYYQSQNFKPKYNYQYTITPVPDKTTVCHIDAQIEIPILEKILYSPSLYELIKEAWCQYFFLFIFVYIIIRFLTEFMLEHKLFSCTERGELINF
mgnify:CR=1 FL=1